MYPMLEPVACLDAEVQDEGEWGAVAVIEREVHHLQERDAYGRWRESGEAINVIALKTTQCRCSAAFYNTEAGGYAMQEKSAS